MVLLSKCVTAIAASVLATGIFAHPGHDVHEEIAQRAAYFATGQKRSLAHCADKLKERGIHDRNVVRRRLAVDHLRKKRALGARDQPKDILNMTHESVHNYTTATPDDVIFASNNSCILSPEVTEGPYYVTGEMVRQDVTEKQPGVPLTLEIQMINVKTCEPVPGALLEIWHSNSTGVYSGVDIAMNGDGNHSNINNTAFRGIQPSKKDGVVVFDTIVPGHYTGRTPHIHVLAHINATVLPNNTITGGTVSHNGQLFFDQSLLKNVQQTHPYTMNTQPLTVNSEDMIMAQEASNGDPIVEYTMLGKNITDGLFGWIAFGIDPTANRTIMAAANYGKDGGKSNQNGFGFGPLPSDFSIPTAFPTAFPSGGFPGGMPGFPSFSMPPGFSIPPFPGFPMPSGGIPPGMPGLSASGPRHSGQPMQPAATSST